MSHATLVLLTCPRDDDDEPPAGGQLPDGAEVLAESLGVGDQIGRHNTLRLGLLEAPFQLRHFQLEKEGKCQPLSNGPRSDRLQLRSKRPVGE